MRIATLRQASLVIAMSIAVAGCAAEPVEESSAAVPTPALTSTTTVSTASPSAEVATSIESQGSLPPSREPEPTLDDLAVLFSKTVDEPWTSFRSILTTRFPGEDAIMSTREARWNDDVASGDGTQAVDGVTISGEPFRYRWIDSSLWFLNPLGEPKAWTRFDNVGPNPSYNEAMVNGDLHLALLLEAAVSVTEVHDIPGDSGATWHIEVRSDDLVPILTQSAGATQRLIDLGGAETGATAIVVVVEDQDGFISGFHGEFSEWWTAALRGAGEADEGGWLRLSFQLKRIDEPETPDQPCEEPEEVVKDGISYGRCPWQEDEKSDR